MYFNNGGTPQNCGNFVDQVQLENLVGDASIRTYPQVTADCCPYASHCMVAEEAQVIASRTPYKCVKPFLYSSKKITTYLLAAVHFARAFLSLNNLSEL
jgi:hypothetical protein